MPRGGRNRSNRRITLLYGARKVKQGEKKKMMPTVRLKRFAALCGKDLHD
jgi:hypothetical protein